MPGTRKRGRMTAVSMAELVALMRVTRAVRDQNGQVVRMERTDGAPLGAPVQLTGSDVLKADRFLGTYTRRPMK